MELMKKVGLLVFLAVIIILAGLGAWYLSSPAKVSIGPEIVSLGVSNGYVLFMNTKGDLRGCVRCPITGLSSYWVERESLYYSFPNKKLGDGLVFVGSGIGISSYAAQGLRKLIETGRSDLAYEIAQQAFERRQQEKYWREEKNQRLIYPLKFMVSPPVPTLLEREQLINR